MVRVTILKDQKDICRGFETSGHAGYADKGQDIVCAAVSVLTINTVNSLEQFTEETFSLDSDEKRGRIALRFSHIRRASARPRTVVIPKRSAWVRRERTVSL